MDQLEHLPQGGRVLGFCFLIAAVSGLFSALAKKLSWRDTVVAAGVSGVGGLVVGAICFHLYGTDNFFLTCAVCGLSGWAGGNLVLDRLTFVAWSIVRGKLPAIVPDLEAHRGTISAESVKEKPSAAPFGPDDARRL